MGSRDAAAGGGPIPLPDDLQRRLREFRSLVRRVKALEAACAAVCGVTAGYLAVFSADRFGETPPLARLAVCMLAVAACGAVPLAIHRWGWRQRGLDAVARLIGRRFPGVGDQILGAIELAGEAAPASRRLREAAISQVAERSRTCDFTGAVPSSRHRGWLVVATALVAMAVVTATLAPDAAVNALARFVAPWLRIDRFTFTRVEPLPDRVVVPRGEPATLVVPLAADTRSRPRQAVAQVTGRRLVADLHDDRYTLALPPLLEATPLALAVGDERGRTTIDPVLRPEITAVEALVTLPDYLERAGTGTRDVRGGTVGVVRGSRVGLVATANRALASATVDGSGFVPQDALVRVPPRVVDEEHRVTITWRDADGLQGSRPLEVTLVPREDEPPTVVPLGLPPSGEMLLDTDTLRFTIAVRDDFGVRRVGIEWQALDEARDGSGRAAAPGERLLHAGGPEATELDVAATFCPRGLGIDPRPLVLRAFAEDFLPGRGRVYSSPVVIHVLDRAEHALVLNTRLQQFRQQAAEIRDRETALLATNEELRGLPADTLADAATRRRIEAQAAAEDANARRLERLVDDGARLLREAVKNPDFEPATLEQLAGDVQALADISGNRMPGVAELLREAAAAPRPPVVPQAVDQESSQQSATPPSADDPGPQAGLGLPSTQAGVSGSRGSGAAGSAVEQPLAEAIARQQELLARFAEVAEDLAAALARLEGSSFVKRLKLAAREQGTIGSRLAGLADGVFGTPVAPAPVSRSLEEVRERNDREAQRVSDLMDDLQSYFDRRQLPAFRTVLEEMRELDTLGSLRQLSTDMAREAGMSIAQAEFWSDTFDRLADELVPSGGDSDPASPGQTASLPPELVVEVLKILDEETVLREETRVAEQARVGLAPGEVAVRAQALSDTQGRLAERVGNLVDRLQDEPDGDRTFRAEIGLFEHVGSVMEEAADILAGVDTGPRAIGAETEAIELLLAAQSSGGAGAGGGTGATAPGGGGGGSATASALALIGRGDRWTRPEGGGESGQATGSAGRQLPEEFRAGLDRYFNRFERGGEP